jgi:hypothetical protein
MSKHTPNGGRPNVLHREQIFQPPRKSRAGNALTDSEGLPNVG